MENEELKNNIENKITYEDLERVNQTIRTTDIKGKEYAEVNQRIKAFRMLYPDGLIESKLISNENGICIFRAYVYNSDRLLLSTGTAYEKEGSTFINKTSYIENAETSAIGRALGIAGFGIDTSVASAEEVQNAINNQENNEEENKTYREQVIAYCKNNNLDIKEIAKEYKLNTKSTENDYKQVLLDIKGD